LWKDGLHSLVQDKFSPSTGPVWGLSLFARQSELVKHEEHWINNIFSAYTHYHHHNVEIIMRIWFHIPNFGLGIFLSNFGSVRLDELFSSLALVSCTCHPQTLSLKSSRDHKCLPSEWETSSVSMRGVAASSNERRTLDLCIVPIEYIQAYKLKQV
jgi:hypothetical protein